MRNWIPLLLLVFIFGNFSAQATIRIAFLELRKWNGDVLILEPDFPYAHVAISEGKGWWHAHPRWGVQNVSSADLKKVGKQKLTIEIFQPEKLDPYVLSHSEALPYDSDFSWGDDAMYCSELVAKLLGIAPKPMHFDPNLWPSQYLALEGQPGISPGGIYREVIKRYANARCELAESVTRGTFSCSDSSFLPFQSVIGR